MNRGALVRALSIAVVLGGALAGLAYSQVIPQPGPPTPIGCAYNLSPVTLKSGQAGWVQCTNDGSIKVNASVSASVTGFAPATTGTPFTATSSGVTGTLPAGTVVVAFNRSSSIPAYCKLGASSTLGDVLVAPTGWFAFTVGAATQLTCITASSTAVINMVGGSGIATGAGGGGGSGGGGGAITAPLGTATAAADSVAVVIQGGSALSAPGQTTMNGSQPVVIASNQSAVPVGAAASGGTAAYFLLAANSTNSTNVKASAGQVYGIQLGNIGTSPAYLKFYDTAGSPTCNSDTIIAQYLIPAGGGTNGSGNNVSFVVGKTFSTGIGFCVTNGIAANDNVAVAASTFLINIDYK